MRHIIYSVHGCAHQYCVCVTFVNFRMNICVDDVVDMCEGILLPSGCHTIIVQCARVRDIPPAKPCVQPYKHTHTHERKSDARHHPDRMNVRTMKECEPLCCVVMFTITHSLAVPRRVCLFNPLDGRASRTQRGRTARTK